MARILIVEDDVFINDLIKINLELVGYECTQAFEAREATRLAGKVRHDLVLLDVMIPGGDGFSLLRTNAFSDVPVIFVTAKSGVADKVGGLKLGADDYITKPFEAVELLARVEAVLRRAGHVETTWKIGRTVVNSEERTASVDGVAAELTNREFELLEVLIRHRNIALSREKLLELAWGYDYYGDTRTVDVHITRLRKKLRLEDAIKTVYRLGYRLEIK